MLQAKIINKDGEYYLEQYDNAILMQTLPTLQEHSSYWEKRIDAVLLEKEFTIKEAKRSVFDTATFYVIPNPLDADILEDLDYWMTNSMYINANTARKIIFHLKQHYTLQKKH